MTGVRCALLLLAWCGCVLAIPSSLLTDVKQAERTHPRLTNKVKRAQEVIMFGNQQNRGGDGRNGYALSRAEKRGGDLENNILADQVTERPHALYSTETDEALEEPKVMAQYDKNYRPGAGEPEYSQRLQNAVFKSEYYTDPAALTDLRYYDLDERRKRETFRTPSKRNSRDLTTARAKRDLDLDPEELLALLSVWENERRNKMQQNRNMYNQYSTTDSDDMDMFDNQDGGNGFGEEEDESRPDGWMDGPIALPSRHFRASGAEPWGRQRFSDDRRKRFMVSKRRPQEGDMYSLAQLLNGPQREAAGPVFRRYVL